MSGKKGNAESGLPCFQGALVSASDTVKLDGAVGKSTVLDPNQLWGSHNPII